MQALILAGGEGTRLRPLTYTAPKPVLPLAGRPHIAYVIDWLVRHGVDDVVVSCGHLAEGVRSALAELEPGVKVRYAEEPDPRGTAGANCPRKSAPLRRDPRPVGTRQTPASWRTC